MPTSGSLLAFAALSFALIAVPGPSVLFIVSRGVALGRRAALLTVVGNAAGIYVQVVLVSLGIGALVEQSVAAFTVLKLIGAAYLVWLGVQTIRRRDQLAAASHPQASTTADAEAPPTTLSVLIEGLVVGVANPKAIVFLAAILPQFVRADGAAAGVQMAVLGLIFVVIALALDSIWAVAAGTARLWFVNSPGRLQTLSGFGGMTMIALGVGLASAGRID